MNRAPTNTPTCQIDISEISAALAHKLQLFSRKFSNPGTYVFLQNMKSSEMKSNQQSGKMQPILLNMFNSN